jgi:hypothetical protein
MTTAVLVSVLAALGLPGTAAPGLAGQAGTPPPLPDIVALASEQVSSFANAAAVLVASEHYVQEVKRRPSATAVPEGALTAGITVERRVLDSEVALVQLLAEDLWMLARDVVSVDGRPLPEGERIRLPRLHPASLQEAVSEFAELHRQGARFNIGGFSRDINFPTLALWFLTPSMRGRFDFSVGRTEEVDGVSCRVVRFSERQTPYLLQVNFLPTQATGRFWVSPETGAVVRSELVLANAARDRASGRGILSMRSTMTVRYGLDERLRVWVPKQMLERFEYPGSGTREFVVGTADYRDYREFTVGTRIVPPK